MEGYTRYSFVATVNGNQMEFSSYSDYLSYVADNS